MGRDEDEESRAKEIVLRRLAITARSRAELASDLVRRGFPSDLIERILDRFTEVGLVDDAALAVSLVSSKARNSGWSRRAAAYRLRERGVPEDAIEMAIESVSDEEEKERALNLVRRAWKQLAGVDEQVRRRRITGMLARRGYSQGMATSVILSVGEERGKT
ncbi:MAG: regulatory protein RecX [Candidatus Nanopelagicales bacterium]|nr:regulatory protein RecX [Candidatus Nanopelagicales bacterium]MDZ4249566.1 regulatory protein RecX [Candidatus Nanopelagicales bacterium]